MGDLALLLLFGIEEGFGRFTSIALASRAFGGILGSGLFVGNGAGKSKSSGCAGLGWSYNVIGFAGTGGNAGKGEGRMAGLSNNVSGLAGIGGKFGKEETDCIMGLIPPGLGGIGNRLLYVGLLMPP